jgi:hypothetical protein
VLEFAARVIVLSGGNLSEYSANDVTLGSKSKVVNIGPNKLTLNFTGSSGSREHAPRPARLGG